MPRRDEKENEIYRLVLKIDSDDKNYLAQFDQKQFEILLLFAIKTVLGETYASNCPEIVDFSPKEQIGSVKVRSKDFHLIWAALCVYGEHLGHSVSFQLLKLFKSIEENDTDDY